MIKFLIPDLIFFFFITTHVVDSLQTHMIDKVGQSFINVILHILQLRLKALCRLRLKRFPPATDIKNETNVQSRLAKKTKSVQALS